MSYVPTPEQALALTMQYNQEEFHITHAKTVGHVMGEFAKNSDPQRVDFWTAVFFMISTLNNGPISIASRRRRFCGSWRLTKRLSML